MIDQEDEKRGAPNTDLAFRVLDLEFHFGPSLGEVWHLLSPEQDPELLKVLVNAKREIVRRLGNEESSVSRKVLTATQVIHEMFPSYNESISGDTKQMLPDDLVFHFREETGNSSYPIRSQILIEHDEILYHYCNSGGQLPLSELLPYAVCSSQSILLHMLLAQIGIKSLVASGRFIVGWLEQNGKVFGGADGAEHSVVWVPADETKSFWQDREAIIADPVCGFSLPAVNADEQYKKQSLLTAQPGDTVPQQFVALSFEQVVEPL